MIPTLLRRALAVAVALSLSCTALHAQGAGGSQFDSLRVPAAVKLLEARPYSVKKPMPFRVDGVEAKIEKGWIVVVEANLRLLQPCQSADYVLFAGHAVGQRVNSGYRDGKLVVVIPEFDPEKDCLWIGSRGVPDRMTKEDFVEERVRAKESGIVPFSKEEWKKARETARLKQRDEPLLARHLDQLWYLTVPLILDYAPAESEMARSLLPGRLDD